MTQADTGHKLSWLQKDILCVLLAHLGGRPQPLGGVRVKAIRERGLTPADRAAFSRAIARLERRGLVIRSNSTSGLPAGHPRAGRVRVRIEEPAPRRTDHLILTPAGEEMAKRLTNKPGRFVNRFESGRKSEPTMSTPQGPSVAPCFRCGQAAELPSVGEGIIAGREESHLPLCQVCLQLLLADTEAFWEPLRARRKET